MTDLVPADPDADKPAAIRLRCLWCGTVTPGWDQGRQAYRRTQEPDLDKRTLRNPKLDAIQAQDAAAEPVAAAGGDRRNVTKFPVAKERRSR